MSEVSAVAGTPAAVVPPAPAATTTPAVSVIVPAIPSQTEPAVPGDQAKAATVPQGAPEKYVDFKVPDGMVVQPELVEKFSAVAKAQGLSQAQAQELVTFQMEAMKSDIAKYESHLAAEKASIPSLIAKDQDLGGANAVAKAETMQRAIRHFGSEKFKAMLDNASPENYMEIARFAYKVGSAIKEDSVAGTHGSPAAQEKRAADILFGPKS